MPRKHGNLYNFDTFPGYGRYFIFNIGRVWLGGIRGHCISKGEMVARARQMTGTAGPKWEEGQPVGGDSRRAERDVNRLSGGRGCVSLWRGLTGRDGGSGEI